MQLFHALHDDLVPYSNATDAKGVLSVQIFDVKPEVGTFPVHIRALKPAIEDALKWFKGEI